MLILHIKPIDEILQSTDHMCGKAMGIVFPQPSHMTDGLNFFPIHFPQLEIWQNYCPYQFHIITQPSHTISTYGSDMAQPLPYHSHTFSLVRALSYLNNIHLLESGFSCQTFKNILNYGKTLILASSDSENIDCEVLLTLWPKIRKSEKKLLKEEGYGENKLLFICICRNEKNK